MFVDELVGHALCTLQGVHLVEFRIARALVGIARHGEVCVVARLHQVGNLLDGLVDALCGVGFALTDVEEHHLFNAFLLHFHHGFLLLDHNGGGFVNPNGVHHVDQLRDIRRTCVFVAEADAQAEHGREHPVVARVRFRVEAVAEAVGRDFERESERLRYVGFEAQAGADVVAQAVFVPCQLRVQVLMLCGNGLQLVIVPRVGEAESAHENEVQRVVVALREQVRQVQEQVGVGGDVVELVVLVELVETALRLPSVHVQAQSHGRREIASDGKSGSGHEQLVDFRVGRGKLHSALRLDEVVGLEFSFFVVLCVGRAERHQRCGHENK